MMKNTDWERHVEKSAWASQRLESLMLERGESPKEAYVLYYFLIETLFQREKKRREDSFDSLYRALRKDKRYLIALRTVMPNMSLKGKIKIFMRRIIPSVRIYSKLSR